MSHQDTDRLTALSRQFQALKSALSELLPSKTLAKICFRRDCTWTPLSLVHAALLWAWSDEIALTDRFVSARNIINTLTKRAPLTSYQAFLKLLVKWTNSLAEAITIVFRQRMVNDLVGEFSVENFRVFAVDGSRLELPRTESHELAYSSKKARRRSRNNKSYHTIQRSKDRKIKARDSTSRDKKSLTPLMWLTMLWNVGTSLPWDWRLGPSDSSERDHLREMLGGLPSNSLITADAGFVGYSVWRTMLEMKHQMLIRVGANVRLLKNLGKTKQRGDLVWLWPDREMINNEPPIILRLVMLHNGRHPIYLVTSIMDCNVLSERQIAEIYGLRWGIELFYRSFKQTYARRKLRSHAGANAWVEATWSLLGLWAMSLQTRLEQVRHGIASRRLSVAKMLRVYRLAMREPRFASGSPNEFRARLSLAVVDEYKRKNKASRNFPIRKRPHMTGKPEIREAMAHEKNIARRLGSEIKGLTA